jgi:hypothetical protein
VTGQGEKVRFACVKTSAEYTKKNRKLKLSLLRMTTTFNKNTVAQSTHYEPRARRTGPTSLVEM